MRALSVDLAKFRSIAFSGEPVTRRREMCVWLSSPELHCVAAFRFGQHAGRLRARNRGLGLLALTIHRVWNRWNTHIHHCDINRYARIGPGMLLMHRHGVLIGPSMIGRNAVIHHNVTIGQRVAHGDHRVPRIGDDVWIGPGAIITGDITIGDGSTISAGAVVSRDIPPRSLVAGNPGRVIASDYDNSAMLNFVVPRTEDQPFGAVVASDRRTRPVRAVRGRR